MNNKKCPYCKECLDLYFDPNGTRMYICFLCGKYFKLIVGGGLEEVDVGRRNETLEGYA